MAKAWGQRTGDGRYALVYNPHLERRFPLVIVHGDDGISFREMRTLHADVPPLRYPGLYKSPGPQYIRGISEWSSDGSWKDAANALWVCYSVNKEDIWVSRVPLPIAAGGNADSWNTYSPKWAPATVTTTDGAESVQLEDRDPGDYARATRLLAKPASSLDVSMEIRIDKGTTEPLHIDLIGPRGAARRNDDHQADRPAPGEWSSIRLDADCSTRNATAQVNAQPAMTTPFAAPVDALTRIDFRTGELAAPASPEADRPTDLSRYQLKKLLVRE